MAHVFGERGNWRFRVDWKDPYATENHPKSLVLPIGPRKGVVNTNCARTVFLAQKLMPLGTVLAIFSASPAEAEKAASEFADSLAIVPADVQSPQLRLAIGLARHEFGADSPLATCLERGVAYHHSSLSPILRYLIEDQVRSKKIRFVAATSTLAQGMNFPVATILVHSVHKPRGRGNFSSAEFWNIAGRAGRVGMVERGLIIFTDPNHQSHLDRFANELRSVLTSALLTILPELDLARPLKDQYREIPALRPFIQYLAHAAASSRSYKPPTLTADETTQIGRLAMNACKGIWRPDSLPQGAEAREEFFDRFSAVSLKVLGLQLSDDTVAKVNGRIARSFDDAARDLASSIRRLRYELDDLDKKGTTKPEGATQRAEAKKVG
jgi:hypothetical protein